MDREGLSALKQWTQVEMGMTYVFVLMCGTESAVDTRFSRFLKGVIFGDGQHKYVAVSLISELSFT